MKSATWCPSVWVIVTRWPACMRHMRARPAGIVSSRGGSIMALLRSVNDRFGRSCVAPGPCWPRQVRSGQHRQTFIEGLQRLLEVLVSVGERHVAFGGQVDVDV